MNQEQISGKPPVSWCDWTIFVTSPDGTDPSQFIEKVVFNIHSDFIPSERCVTSYPFEVSEHGHGFFPATARLFFRCPDVNPVDIVIPVRWDQALPSLHVYATAITFAGIPLEHALQYVFPASLLPISKMASSAVPQEVLALSIQDLLEDEKAIDIMNDVCAKLQADIINTRKKIALARERIQSSSISR